MNEAEILESSGNPISKHEILCAPDASGDLDWVIGDTTTKLSDAALTCQEPEPEVCGVPKSYVGVTWDGACDTPYTVGKQCELKCANDATIYASGTTAVTTTIECKSHSGALTWMLGDGPLKTASLSCPDYNR